MSVSEPNSNPTDLPLVKGWGNFGVHAREIVSSDLERSTEGAVLTRGIGRSYGDSSLPPSSRPEVVSSRLADRILSFDPETGRLRAEAGFTLYELNRVFLRRGWFSPVTPGTQFVTLGGMVASDVHGKNAHVAGTFGSNHVRSLLMRTADNQLVECSPEQHPDLFWATIGGMGLTGHILELEFELEKISSPWIYSESRRIDDIDEFIEALKTSSKDWPYGVGWIDCLSRGKKMGRGILDYGRWATPEEAGGKPLPFTKRLAVPFTFPEWVLGPLSVKAFNTAYYWKHFQRSRQGLKHPDSFFYPLDAILHWNRIYGRRGFTQYQCVLPESAGRGSARRFLDRLTRLGGASFLCVIKDCGPQGDGMLSFPMPGISIALDIAIRDNTQKLVDELNELVIDEGGRIYLTKDTFTRPEHFREMEPRLDSWLAVREKWDPEQRIRSAQSVRIFGDPA